VTGRLVIALDVDGPLNPYDAKASRRPEGYTTHRLRPAGWRTQRKPLRVWLNPSHGRLLLDLASRVGGDLVWATSWRDEANTMIAPVIHLPTLPVIDLPPGYHAHAAWKYGPVADYADGRPLVWFDDEFADPERSAARCDFEAYRGDLPTLLARISPRIGLTAADLDAAVQWWAAQ
jgi:hypothetical protein